MKIFLTLVVILLLGLGAFFYFKDQTFAVRIHESTLQAAMQERMPIEKRYLALVNVTLSEPQVDLLEETDRFHVAFDVAVNLALGDVTEPLNGTVAASGAIRYEPASGAVFLVEPVVETLAVEGLSDTYQEQVETAVSKALDGWYSSHPVYTLEATDLKTAAAKRVLQSVAVDGNDLVIAFGLGEPDETIASRSGGL